MAQFDTSIYGQIRPLQIQSPFEQRAQFEELQRAKNQNRLAQMQFNEADRADSERNSLADLSRQYGNSPEYAQELMRGGYGQQANAQMKLEADRRKAEAEGVHQGLQSDKIRGDIDAQKMKLTKDQNAEAMQTLLAIKKNPNRSRGMIIDEISQEIQRGKIKPDDAKPLLGALNNLPDNVQSVDRFLDQIMSSMQSAQQQSDASAKQRDDDYRAKNDAANRAQTKRGQDMTDARGREFNATKVEENNIRRSEKVTELNASNAGKIASFDTMLGSLDRLASHPGLKRSVGVNSAFNALTIPGSDSATFLAELETFKAQSFLPMVAQLKGLGALSNAEGEKLTAAVGALNPKMGEQAFRASLARVQSDMVAARARLDQGAQQQQIMGSARHSMDSPVSGKPGGIKFLGFE